MIAMGNTDIATPMERYTQAQEQRQLSDMRSTQIQAASNKLAEYEANMGVREIERKKKISSAKADITQKLYDELYRQQDNPSRDTVLDAAKDVLPPEALDRFRSVDFEDTEAKESFFQGLIQTEKHRQAKEIEQMGIDAAAQKAAQTSKTGTSSFNYKGTMQELQNFDISSSHASGVTNAIQSLDAKFRETPGLKHIKSSKIINTMQTMLKDPELKDAYLAVDGGIMGIGADESVNSQALMQDASIILQSRRTPQFFIDISKQTQFPLSQVLEAFAIKNNIQP